MRENPNVPSILRSPKVITIAAGIAIAIATIVTVVSRVQNPTPGSTIDTLKEQKDYKENEVERLLKEMRGR